MCIQRQHHYQWQRKLRSMKFYCSTLILTLMELEFSLLTIEMQHQNCLLCDHCNIYAAGMCKSSRIGWTKWLFRAMPTSCTPKGIFERFYDSNKKMRVTQWKDTKIVKIVNSTLVPWIGWRLRGHVAPKLVHVQCPKDIIMYQQNMEGIDNRDQIRLHGTGLVNKACTSRNSTRKHFLQ